MYSNGKKVDDPDRMKFETEEFYIKSPEEMTSLFEYVPQAIENTEKIAKRCNVDFDFGTRHLPAYAVPDGKDAFEYLRELCQSGLENDIHLYRTNYRNVLITNSV